MTDPECSRRPRALEDSFRRAGTHSGGEEEYQFPWYIIRNNLAAGGSALSSLIGWARANW